MRDGFKSSLKINVFFFDHWVLFVEDDSFDQIVELLNVSFLGML
jgi:hypothetical protein